MKIALTSDTHYGFNRKTHGFHDVFLKELDKEIKAQGVEVLIHAGDWSCTKQKSFYKAMKMLRKYIDIPIVTVRGNHDFWQYTDRYNSKMMWGQLQNKHKEWFKEHDIHHLESGSFVMDDVIICGFDGWYGKADPPTNDAEMMIGFIEGCPAMVYLSSRAYKELNRVLDTDISNYRKSICVSHFPPYGGSHNSNFDRMVYEFSANKRYMEPITEKFDFFCVGHSHRFMDKTINDCRVLNAGSDYNLPKYIIFDV